MNPNWPELPLSEWRMTCATLHLWTQIVGKIVLGFSPVVNHWWEVAFQVTANGLKTGPIPIGSRIFDMEFDFIDHTLRISTSDGIQRNLALTPKTVAEFYRELMDVLGSIGIEAKINVKPQEIPNPVPFDQDEVHGDYAPEYAHRFWRILVQVDRVFREFRTGFVGKSSPVQFFWGSFDLSVSRFSGRLSSQPRTGVITREAYSHENMSVGFWPGSGNIEEPAFFSYAYPEPPGYPQAKILPKRAFYNPPTKGFILPYDEVRKSANPDRMILDFAQSSYEAAANLAEWDRPALDRAISLQRRAA